MFLKYVKLFCFFNTSLVAFTYYCICFFQSIRKNCSTCLCSLQLPIVFFITFFIYDRYDSCSRSNIHGSKASPEAINFLNDRTKFIRKVFIKFCRNSIIARKFICLRFINFMIWSKDILASQRLNLILDVFFLLRILVINSVEIFFLG